MSIKSLSMTLTGRDQIQRAMRLVLDRDEVEVFDKGRLIGHSQSGRTLTLQLSESLGEDSECYFAADFGSRGSVGFAVEVLYALAGESPVKVQEWADKAFKEGRLGVYWTDSGTQGDPILEALATAEAKDLERPVELSEAYMRHREIKYQGCHTGGQSCMEGYDMTCHVCLGNWIAAEEGRGTKGPDHEENREILQRGWRERADSPNLEDLRREQEMDDIS